MWPSTYPSHLPKDRGTHNTFRASGKMSLRNCSYHKIESNTGSNNNATTLNSVSNERVDHVEKELEIIDRFEKCVLTRIRCKPNATFADVRGKLLHKLAGTQFDFVTCDDRVLLRQEEPLHKVPRIQHRIIISFRNVNGGSLIEDTRSMVDEVLRKLCIVLGPTFFREFNKHCSQQLDLKIYQVTLGKAEELLRSFISKSAHDEAKQRESLEILRNSKLYASKEKMVDVRLLLEEKRPQRAATNTALTSALVKAFVDAHEHGIQVNVHGTEICHKDKLSTRLEKVGTIARFYCGQEVTIKKPKLDGSVQRVIRTEGKYVVHANVDGKKLLYELDREKGGSGCIAISDFAERFNFIEAIEAMRAADLKEAFKPFADADSNKLIVRAFLRHCFPGTDAPLVDGVLSKLREHYYLRSFGGIKFKQSLQQFDPNTGGHISVENFQKCLAESKVHVTATELNQLLDHLDPTCSNSIDYIALLASLEKGCCTWKNPSTLGSEFKYIVQENYRKTAKSHTDFEAAFKALDKDEDGFISAKDLKEAFQKDPFVQFSALHLSEIVRMLESSKHTERLAERTILVAPKPYAATVGLGPESFKHFVKELEETALEKVKSSAVAAILSRYFDDAAKSQSFRQIYDSFFDVEGNGELSADAFVKGIKELCGYRLTYAQGEYVVNSMKKFDKKVCFRSFLEMLCPCTSADIRAHVNSVIQQGWESRERAMNDLLQSIDTSVEGFSQQNFNKQIRTVGVDLADEHIKLLFDELKSNCGVVEREALLGFLREPKLNSKNQSKLDADTKDSSELSGSCEQTFEPSKKSHRSNGSQTQHHLARNQIESYFRSSVLGSM